MSMLVPIIRVKADNEQGFVKINESDFDKEKHKLYKGSLPESRTEDPVLLEDAIRGLIDKGENLKDDGYPRIKDVRKATGNSELTSEQYDACLKEHFSIAPE